MKFSDFKQFKKIKTYTCDMISQGISMNWPCSFCDTVLNAYKMRMQHFGLNTAGRVRCGLPTKRGLWQETIGVQNRLVFKVGSRTD